MPNWCDNRLILTHKNPEMIEKAIDAFKRGEFCAEFAPMPDGLDWYGWNTENWGTKWDFGEEDGINDQEDENTVEFVFESAWSPPVALYHLLEEEFDFDVEAYYYEPGMMFCGKFDEDGHQYYSIDGDSQWVEDNIPTDIEQEFNIIEHMEMFGDEEEEENSEED